MGFNLHSGFQISYFDVRSPKLVHDVSFVVMSDLHECFFGRGNEKLISAIRRINPDFIAVAGDMVDAEAHGNCEAVMELLGLLSKEYPLYFGVGNHERYLIDKDILPEQKRRFLNGLKKYSLKLMRNETISIEYANIDLVGLDLPRWYYRKTYTEQLDIEAMQLFVGDCDKRKFNILLAHDPDHFKVYAEWGADLVLSGHVHGGSIGIGKNKGLISPKLKFFPEYSAGRYEHNGSTMLLSRGLGNHTINFRLNNPPELMVVKLRIDNR